MATAPAGPRGPRRQADPGRARGDRQRRRRPGRSWPCTPTPSALSAQRAERSARPSAPRSCRTTAGSAAAARPACRCPAGRSRLPEPAAPALRAGDPAVLPRVHDGACLVDPAVRPRGRRRAAARRGPRGAGRLRSADVYVVATAGHVDHGKSTLVRALTGMEPDRWAEERRRGLTIDLGFAWTTLPSGRRGGVRRRARARAVPRQHAGRPRPGAGGLLRRRRRRGLAGRSPATTATPSRHLASSTA